MIKSKFYYDFYFKGQFVKRFQTIEKAKKMITWPLLMTYPVNLWEIKRVKRKKLSTERKANKIKGCKKCQD